MTAAAANDVSAATLTDIAALPERDWMRLLSDRDLFLLPGWMRVGPGTYGGGLRGSCAVTVGRDGRVVCGTGAWVFGQECTEDLCRPDVLLEVSPATGRPMFPTVLAGGWYDSRIAHVPGDLQPGDLLAVVTELEQWGAAEGATTICWPSVDNRERELTGILAERGYHHVPLPDRWALEGPWTSFDDYLSRLPSKRRIAVKHELRVVAEAGVTCRSVPLTKAMAGELVDLAAENVRRHGGEVDAQSYTEWVAALADIPAGAARAHLAERAGRVVGCVVSSTYAGRLYGLFPGFSYKDIAGLPVYFALAYYHLVAFAAEHGISAIEYGPTADAAKRGRGCIAYGQGLWIKGLCPESSALLGVICSQGGDERKHAYAH